MILGLNSHENYRWVDCYMFYGIKIEHAVSIVAYCVYTSKKGDVDPRCECHTEKDISVLCAEKLGGVERFSEFDVWSNGAASLLPLRIRLSRGEAIALKSPYIMIITLLKPCVVCENTCAGYTHNRVSVSVEISNEDTRFFSRGYWSTIIASFLETRMIQEKRIFVHELCTEIRSKVTFLHLMVELDSWIFPWKSNDKAQSSMKFKQRSLNWSIRVLFNWFFNRTPSNGASLNHLFVEIWWKTLLVFLLSFGKNVTLFKTRKKKKKMIYDDQEDKKLGITSKSIIDSSLKFIQNCIFKKIIEKKF